MSTIDEFAAISAGRIHTEIQTALAVKVREQVKVQQQAAINLIDAALQTARQIQSVGLGDDEGVDLLA